MDSELWALPPLSELATKPAIVQKMWGIYETSKRYMGGEWQEFPKMELETSSHIWQFYRHGELYGSVRCDKVIQEYWYNEKHSIAPNYKTLSGWDRQAMQIYADSYQSALTIKQENSSG